jgi:hypothetical protein
MGRDRKPTLSPLWQSARNPDFPEIGRPPSRDMLLPRGRPLSLTRYDRAISWNSREQKHQVEQSGIPAEYRARAALVTRSVALTLLQGPGMGQTNSRRETG